MAESKMGMSGVSVDDPGSEPLDYVVRRMEGKEIPKALAVWTETGLVEGTHSMETWYGVDPHGFYVAVDRKGQILGVLSGIILKSDLCFIGLYAVKAEFRGKGVGKQIWRAVMEHLGSRNIGLNAVPEHLHTYRDQCGFKFVADWVIVLYSGIPTVDNIPEEKTIADETVKIIDFQEELLKATITYDSKVHGYRRERAVTLTTMEEDCLTVVAVSSNGSEDKIRGYGSIRKCVQATTLPGPIYADQPEIAEMILGQLVRSFPAAQELGVTMSPLSNNPASLKLAEKIGLQREMDCPRCYNHAIVEADFSKIFSTHALNFSTF